MQSVVEFNINFVIPKTYICSVQVYDIPCSLFDSTKRVSTALELRLNATAKARLGAAKMKHLLHLNAAVRRTQTRS
jgi:hypothetical protein